MASQGQASQGQADQGQAEQESAAQGPAALGGTWSRSSRRSGAARSNRSSSRTITRRSTTQRRHTSPTPQQRRPIRLPNPPPRPIPRRVPPGTTSPQQILRLPPPRPLHPPGEALGGPLPAAPGGRAPPPGHHQGRVLGRAVLGRPSRRRDQADAPPVVLPEPGGGGC